MSSRRCHDRIFSLWLIPFFKRTNPSPFIMTPMIAIKSIPSAFTGSGLIRRGIARDSINNDPAISTIVVNTADKRDNLRYPNVILPVAGFFAFFSANQAIINAKLSAKSCNASAINARLFVKTPPINSITVKSMFKAAANPTFFSLSPMDNTSTHVVIKFSVFYLN
ncbi:hypothetical protein MSTHC_0390 [Methanosarcina thermophila CHTI-55]|uniref:Uncharacterized protein n=2 Tax=Methanosarcina thermophila TaxID=2210 RepID=A0A0E3NGX5_METTE|nr:hypothetical protein MSTHT_0333 [Methanosarcina thermophila TM-1]AKB14708.1 hypothetical protein MSTHC_0390 [Methanosarcina thermophila CHTI-55]